MVVTSQAAVDTAKKTAEDNAAKAARIKSKLLTRLEKEIDNLPDLVGSEASINEVQWNKDKNGNKVRTERTLARKLKDLTSAYKDLTDDMPKERNNPALERLDQMLAEVKNIASNS